MPNAGEIIAEASSLAYAWSARADAFKKWYKLIRLHDDLKQPKMESVISADPRTGFNMAKWLLVPRTSSFSVDTSGMTQRQASSVGRVQAYADRQLVRALRASRGTLFGSFVERVIGLMLATGWYSFITFPTDEGWVMEAWNPAQVYPDYDSEGRLIRLARRYRVTKREAEAKARAAGWHLPPSGLPFNTVMVTNLWKREAGYVTHAVTLGSFLAKPTSETPFRSIPVLVAPVAGLPDDGSIMQDDKWKAEVGQSVVAPIADVQSNYNKMLTFVQQILRDTANPRWVEEVRDQGVLTPDNLFERGVIYSIEPGEKIYAVPPPPIPPELRGHEFDLRNQIQRGLFSDISFGNITQQVSGFLMSQVTAAAQQVLHPFHRALKDALGEAATHNIALMRRWGLDLDGEPFPRLPHDLYLDFNYDIEIPGDFIQRASAARVLNPNFRVSQGTLVQVLFPEVKSAILERTKLQTEDAMDNPVFKGVLMIGELARAAQEARENNDEVTAGLLERAASLMERNLFQPEPGTVGGRTGSERVPPEVRQMLTQMEA